MKLFVPAVGYRIKLTSDWTFDVYHEHRNKTLLLQISSSYNVKNYNCYIDNDWTKGLKHDSHTFPAGTLLEVDRVYVRTASKTATSVADDYDSLTFKVISGGKGKIRFWAKLSDVNNIEYELPDDFKSSKEEAAEKAKKPKKLKPQDIANEISAALSAWSAAEKPAWYTQTCKKSMEQLTAEYEKRQRPIDEARNREYIEREEAAARQRFEHGELSIPVGLSGVVKTFDDYKKFVNNFTRNVEINRSNYKFDYFIPYTMLRSSFEAKSVFSHDKDGRPVRRFSRKTLDELGPNWGDHDRYADITDMWVEVVTNNDDTQIVEVRCGIDKK